MVTREGYQRFEDEIVLAERENVLRQKLVVQAVNAKYALLRTALGQ